MDYSFVQHTKHMLGTVKLWLKVVNSYYFVGSQCPTEGHPQLSGLLRFSKLLWGSWAFNFCLREYGFGRLKALGFAPQTSFNPTDSNVPSTVFRDWKVRISWSMRFLLKQGSKTLCLPPTLYMVSPLHWAIVQLWIKSVRCDLPAKASPKGFLSPHHLSRNGPFCPESSPLCWKGFEVLKYPSISMNPLSSPHLPAPNP